MQQALHCGTVAQYRCDKAAFTCSLASTVWQRKVDILFAACLAQRGMAKAVFMSSKPSSMLHSCTLQCGIAKAAFHVQHACLVVAATDGLAT